MSGGSLDYISSNIEDTISSIRTRYPKNATMQQFCDHLEKVGAALHDIDWEMSGDASLDEVAKKNISEIIGGTKSELEWLVNEAKRVRQELDETLERCKNERE